MSTIEPTRDSEEWQTTDDYGPAWRNPLFREALSDVEASGALGDGLGAARPSESTHICRTTLTRDGGEPQ